MEVNARIVVFSHLSDLPYLQDPQERHRRCEFLKYILVEVPDLGRDIDPDQMWLSFAQSSSLFPKARLREDLSHNVIPTCSGEYLSLKPEDALTVVHQDEGESEFGLTVFFQGRRHQVNSIDFNITPPTL